jgi:hypothetical protein
MLVTLTEVAENTKSRNVGSAERTKVYTLREILVNPTHVVCLREDGATNRLMSEGRLPDGLDSRQRFTRVFLERGQSGIDLIVVGSPEQVREMIRENNDRELLKG